jgi:hypothetical protein
MALQFGDLILCRYLNFKMDPAPMVFILKSDPHYTEGLNSHYLTRQEAFFVRRLLGQMPNNQNNIAYQYLKGNASSILRAYRKYFTNLLVVLRVWKVRGITDADAALMQTVQDIEKQSGILPPNLKQKVELAYKEELRLAKNAKERERYWLNKSNQTTLPQEKELYQKIAYQRGTSQTTIHRRVGGILRGKESEY